MLKNHSYFSFGNGIKPGYWLDKWLNPYTCNKNLAYRENNIKIKWTQRAQRALAVRKLPLTVEMQVYFSCVVKKRVLFHDEHDLAVTAVNEKLNMAFHTVEAASCDPVEFAKNYPAKRTLDSNAAIKMHPRLLCIDFKNDQWRGEFMI